MTTEKTDGFRLTAARFRLAVLLSDLTEAHKVVAGLMLEHLHGETGRRDGSLVTWIGVPTMAAVLGLHPRTIKAARTTMLDTGILVDCHEGGRGAGDTKCVEFSMRWLEDMEAKLRQGGQFAKLGKGKGQKGDRTATLPGLFDRTADGGMGDRTTTHSSADFAGVKGGEDAMGDSSVTLVAPDAQESHPQAVDNPAARPLSVDKSGSETVQDTARVAIAADKGGSEASIRVNVESPEHIVKQGSNPARARTRGPRQPGQPPIPSAQLNIMLPIDCGPVGRAMAESRAAAAARSDGHLETLLERAGGLLGDRGKGNLAVSALQSTNPILFQGLIRGQELGDPELRTALKAALDACQGAEAVPASAPLAPPPAAPPAPSLGVSEEVVALTVTKVLAAMAPTLVAATLAALRGEQAAAA
ncbi:hypothetical protein J2847_006446 [Azospirillum agricola]|uniref:hypothetical protein n=1 Tax=Azospirillum agricola TaxID=1720247 RepID=UPI001AE27ED4|nr:hypothetical protein [Azospirillum agricola]MBP2233111.1 hypothetical protein [Azospirillum agricola]